MAIKDWKKTQDDLIGIDFNKGDFFIRIRNLSIIDQEGFLVGYGRENNYGQIFSNTKSFKTKLQALRYARKYMKTH